MTDKQNEAPEKGAPRLRWTQPELHRLVAGSADATGTGSRADGAAGGATVYS